MAHTSTFRVSTTARRAYRSVRSALAAAAQKGGTAVIEVDPGHYVDPLSIQGEVHIRATEGAGSVVIEAPSGFGTTSFGAVTLTDLVLSSRSNANLLTHHGGKLLLERCSLWGMDSQSLCCEQGAHVVVRDCEVHSGRVVINGSGGHLERTRFVSAVDNAIAVVNGAHAAVSHCRIEASRSDGITVRDGFATIAHTEITRSGNAGIAAENRSQISVSDCELHDFDTVGVLFRRNSGGTVEDVRINNAETGVKVQEQADPAVRRCTLTGCRDSGINVDNRGRGKYEDCTIVDPDQVGAFVNDRSAPEFHRITIRGGAAGAAVRSARAAFSELTVSGADNVGVRAMEGSSVECTSMVLDQCGCGLHATGESTRLRASGVQISDARKCAAIAQGAARVELTDLSGRRPLMAGFECTGESRTHIRDAKVDFAGIGGVATGGSAQVIAENLTITNSENYGFSAAENSHIELAHCTFQANNDRDLVITSGECTGRIHGCTIDAEVDIAENSLIARSGMQEPSELTSAASGGATGEPQLVLNGTTETSCQSTSGALAELDRLIGLSPVKEQVTKQINVIRIAAERKKQGLAVAPISRNLVFSGPSGTGKTTVARLYGKLLAELGVLAEGHVLEVSRTDLVGKYLGHTAQQTRATFERAYGGILFIDEAYALARQFGGNADFGQESIDELITLMENHRDDVVVIAAGYPGEMDDFLNSNPGLRSRFARTIEFPAYSPSELLEIIKLMAEQNNYTFSEEALIALFTHFEMWASTDGGGNGRNARTLFESTVENQATRLSDVGRPTRDQLCALEVKDIPFDG